MAVQPKQYTAEFKAEAVRLMNQGDLSVSEVGRDLGINPNLLSKWKRQTETGQMVHASGHHGYVTFPGQDHSHDEEVTEFGKENQAALLEAWNGYFSGEQF